MQQRTGRFGLVTMALHADHDSALLDSQAEVVAQDRWLVMDPRTAVTDSDASASQLARHAAEEVDHELGQILMRRNSSPLRLWAVIHDLSRLPTSDPSWIAMALINIMRELNHRHIDTLCLPCLGCADGTVGEEQFLLLLADAMHKAPVVQRLHINLYCEAPHFETLNSALQKLEF